MLIKTLTFFLTRMWKKSLFIISAVVKPAYLSWNNQFWRKSFLCIIIHQGFSRISGKKIFHTKRVFEYAYAKLICQSKTTKLSFLFFLYQFSGWLYISFFNQFSKFYLCVNFHSRISPVYILWQNTCLHARTINYLTKTPTPGKLSRWRKTRKANHLLWLGSALPCPWQHTSPYKFTCLACVNVYRYIN